MSNPFNLISEDSFNSKLTSINNSLLNISNKLENMNSNLRPGSVTLSTNNVTLTTSSPTATVKLSNITGEPSIVTIGDNFNATLENGTITITKTDIWSETGEILVSISGNGVYTSTVAIITVIVDDLSLITWSEGTDEKIIRMIEADSQGIIDLKDYWVDGEERTSNGITYTLKNGITYIDENNETQISKFKIICDLGKKSTYSFPVCSFSKSGYAYKRAYSDSPYINFLNKFKLKFIAEQNTTNSSGSIRYNQVSVYNWYCDSNDLKNIYPSGSPIESENYINYICSEKTNNIPCDPANPSTVIYTYASRGSSAIVITKYINDTGNVISTTLTGTEANPSVVSNVGILAYFLI